MNVHDVIFAAGSVALIAALVPALFKKIDLPVWTAALTGFVLAVYGINYLTMGYLLSAAGLLVQALLWGLITYRAATSTTYQGAQYTRPDSPSGGSWYDDWHSPTKRHSSRWHRDEEDN